MVINRLMASTFALFFGFGALNACGVEKKDRVIKLEIYPGQKVIFIGKKTGLKAFGKILNDWDKIHEAIYTFKKLDCVRDNLTIDSIDSFEVPVSQSVNIQKETSFILGTIDPCGNDETSSGPAWKISENGGVYTVTGYSTVEE